MRRTFRPTASASTRAFSRQSSGYGADKFLGYQVERSVTITLRDVSAFEALLTKLLEAGVNRVLGIEFRTSELRKHRDTARARAIRAAREKALALAGELGQNVGRPHTIRELQEPARRSMGMESNRTLFDSAEGPDVAAAFAPGQIVIRASVSVSFELEEGR